MLGRLGFADALKMLWRFDVGGVVVTKPSLVLNEATASMRFGAGSDTPVYCYPVWMALAKKDVLFQPIFKSACCPRISLFNYEGSSLLRL